MVGLLSYGAGKLVTNDMEKAEELNTFFASLSTSKTSLQEFQDPETRREIWNLGSGGPDKGAPLVLRELVNAIARPLLILSSNSRGDEMFW